MQWLFESEDTDQMKDLANKYYYSPESHIQESIAILGSRESVLARHQEVIDELLGNG